MKPISTIAERLKEYRTSHNLSFNELERLTGVPAQTLNRYELGQRLPKLDIAVKLAESLCVHPMWLQGYDVPEKMPATKNDDGLADICKLFSELTPDNRAKLLELGRLYLDAQRKSE